MASGLNNPSTDAADFVSTTQFNVSITPMLRQRINEEAKRRGVSKAMVFNDAMALYFANPPKVEPSEVDQPETVQTGKGE